LSTLAVVAVLALATSGCSFLIAATARPGVPGDALRIVAPVNHTQLPSGPIPVTLDVHGIQPGSLHVGLETGTVFLFPRDITSRFSVSNGTATGTLQPSDIQEGLTRLLASGRDAHGHTILRDAVWSYEPNVDVSLASRCEFLGQSRCQLPFPSNWFTVADPTSDTGRRVHFDPASMESNTSGQRIDPTEWNRNDGFSPGSAIILLVPGIDLAQTGAAPITDIGRSLDSDQPIVLLDADTGQRVPFFAELDANATSDATRTLIIRPARNFAEGHRIIVGLRNLKRADGSVIPASRSFQLYRDQIPTFLPAVEGRRPAMEDVIGHLQSIGWHRSSMYLAWDFTVASERNISERVLHIRDDAFASLHGAAPSFTVTGVQDNVSSTIFRRVTGTYQVPLYLTGDGGPGSRFNYSPNAGPDALPVRNGTYTAPFTCNIPRSVTADGNDPVTPGTGLTYGHGLLGSGTEVNSFGTQANITRSVMCATDWIGMSSADIANVFAINANLSLFPTLADRVQQGFVNQLFLARLVKDPNGFDSSSAFRAGASATPVITPGNVVFNGNSQGGILGGALTAISTEFTRSVLGVPGMNFSTLLDRSVDFDAFRPTIQAAYPDEVDQILGKTMIQMLWDRAEADGYAEHMTSNPLPGTPEHQVMLIEAFGDHQVTNIATENEARTVPGMHVWMPNLDPGRSLDVTPMWDIPAIPSTPFAGNVLVEWDYGTPAPPPTNTPNRAGIDPHGLGAGNPVLTQQVASFLGNGLFVDVCNGGPCKDLVP
jgi:hypothetical protein